MTIWHILLAWLCLSFLATTWLGIAGYRLHRMQERNRFAWNKPLRYLELGRDEYCEVCPSHTGRTLH